MPVKDVSIDDKLISVAKQEFLLHGYAKASVNIICEKVGVTTGALFRRFKSKEDLFLSIIMPTVTLMCDLFKAHHQILLKERTVEYILNGSVDGQRRFIEYIYANLDLFTLMFISATSKMMEKFMDMFVEIEVASMVIMVKQYNPDYFDSDEILYNTAHMLSTSYFNALFEIVRHKMPKEESYIYIKYIEDFYRTGWLKILGQM